MAVRKRRGHRGETIEIRKKNTRTHHEHRVKREALGSPAKIIPLPRISLPGGFFKPLVCIIWDSRKPMFMKYWGYLLNAWLCESCHMRHAAGNLTGSACSRCERQLATWLREGVDGQKEREIRCDRQVATRDAGVHTHALSITKGIAQAPPLLVAMAQEHVFMATNIREISLSHISYTMLCWGTFGKPCTDGLFVSWNVNSEYLDYVTRIQRSNGRFAHDAFSQHREKV